MVRLQIDRNFSLCKRWKKWKIKGAHPAVHVYQHKACSNSEMGHPTQVSESVNMIKVHVCMCMCNSRFSCKMCGNWMILILKLIVLSMTVMMMIDLHSNPYYLGLLMYMYVKCAHSLVQNKGRFFQNFLQENNTRCRVCLQKCTTKTIFSLSILIIEPDSLHSERDISSEDSPPEKPVNGKHTSILPSQVPSHLLMISILEHLCQMYAQDAEQGKKLFQGKNKNSPKVYLKRRG